MCLLVAAAAVRDAKTCSPSAGRARGAGGCERACLAFGRPCCMRMRVRGPNAKHIPPVHNRAGRSIICINKTSAALTMSMLRDPVRSAHATSDPRWDRPSAKLAMSWPVRGTGRCTVGMHGRSAASTRAHPAEQTWSATCTHACMHVPAATLSRHDTACRGCGYTDEAQAHRTLNVSAAGHAPWYLRGT